MGTIYRWRVDTESFYDLNEGDLYEIYQSGGGGYGDPLQRPVADVKRDVKDGLVSPAAAKAKYGVVIDPDTQQVDEAATAELRSA